jgi:hypothetical protein
MLTAKLEHMPGESDEKSVELMRSRGIPAA